MKPYKILNTLTSILFLYLFYVLMFDSGSFFVDIDLNAGEAALILARRASIFMIGISVLLFFSKNLSHSDARQVIIITTSVVMLGLAVMGTYELVRGSMGTGILKAIVIESILGVSYLTIFFSNRGLTVDEKQTRS